MSKIGSARVIVYLAAIATPLCFASCPGVGRA